MERTEREQNLRNEVGQLTHKIHQMIDDRKVMHADLVAQREDIKVAISLLELGTVRDAIQVLKDALAHRDRTRKPRKNQTIGAAA
jgi:hypothetical protein